MVLSAKCGYLAEYWDLIPAIVGGLIGALAGGIPAWLLAKRQSDEALRRDTTQRTESQKALAFSTLIKLQLIIDSTISLSNHVKSRMALRDDPSHAHMEPWQVLIPEIGYTDEGSIRFTAEEMAVFAAAGEYDFMQDMMLLAVRHASSLASFQEYCSMRNKFFSVGPKPERFEGEFGLTTLTREENDSYKPYTIPLNNVALGLDALLDEDERLARSVAANYGPVTKRYFNDERFGSLYLPTNEELAAMRQPPDLTARHS